MIDSEKEIRLASLRQSISEMSDEELRDVIKQTRNNRVAPPPKRKSKAKAKSSAPLFNKKKELDLDSLTPEQAAALILKLTKSHDA